MPGTFSTHALDEVPSSISFWVVRRCQHSLDSEGAHQFTPYITHKFPTSVRQKAERCSKVWNYMPEEGFAHRACGVVARGDEDGIPRVAIHKHNEEFLSVVGG